jgi:hypothetical protein
LVVIYSTKIAATYAGIYNPKKGYRKDKGIKVN